VNSFTALPAAAADLPVMAHISSTSSDRRAAIAAALAFMLLASPAAAQREEAVSKNATLRTAAASSSEVVKRSRDEAGQPVVYKPPRRGSPRGRVAGGVRNASAALPEPLALAPDHVAETISASPSLFWHLDGTPPEASRIVFTLIEAGAIAPIVERQLPLPASAGIQRVRLADFGVTLDRDVEYEWSISLQPAGDDHTSDMVSQRYVRRVDPSELGGRAPSARAFAEQGLWYDALEALSDAIDNAPGDVELRAQRDSLLRQAGLDAALASVTPAP
jgi:uncharacterized protein DUF928